MERIENGLYTVTDKKTKTITHVAHDCKKYKDRESARVFLEKKGNKWVCPFCGFEWK